MTVTSAAVCLWRWADSADTPAEFHVLIVHPGGPYWAKKHEGAWSFPKGEYDPDAEPGLAAARREFAEELGSEAPTSGFVELGQTKLKSGKRIDAWAVEGDLDEQTIVSNTFEMQWPPRSGNMAHFPEIDRAKWCNRAEAAELLNPAQVIFVDRLAEHLAP